MDNICYTVIIRQQMCQSGVPVTRENVYTNISQNSIIDLLNGYTLSFAISTNDTANLRFINTLFDIDLVFNIAENTVNVFDLPVENTIFRVSVIFKARCCDEQESNKCPCRR